MIELRLELREELVGKLTDIANANMVEVEDVAKQALSIYAKKGKSSHDIALALQVFGNTLIATANAMAEKSHRDNGG